MHALEAVKVLIREHVAHVIRPQHHVHVPHGDRDGHADTPLKRRVDDRAATGGAEAFAAAAVDGGRTAAVLEAEADAAVVPTGTRTPTEKQEEGR